MLAKPLIAALAAGMLAAPGLTAPTATTPTLDARAELFKVCRAINFGDCWDSPANIGSCINAPGSWNDVISSVKTTDAGIRCYIYKDHDCSGGQGGPVTSDDRHRDLRDFGWNDVISSWRCQYI